MSLRAIVLGAAAGGGLPQWNCGCEGCRLAREGAIPEASQSSLAVSADGRSWALLNASPDLRSQLAATPALHPTGLREVPIASVLLTNGDIDHVGGLLTMREMQPFRLLATSEIHEVLDANPIFGALSAVERVRVAVGTRFELAPGLSAELFPVPGKVPLYLEEGEDVATDLEGEQTVGVRLTDGASVACYVPGCAAVTDRLLARVADADCLFFDGTLWRDDEMVRAGLSHKTGRRMGHVSIGGPEGSMAALAGLSARKVYVHMNNTNPVLRPGTPERQEAEAAGWTVAADGLEIEL
jgi:pyrroloquinoline quinone biosynthesis protein B